MSDLGSPGPKKISIAVCVSLFLLALGVRLVGIGWGLKNDLHNQSLHPDEPLIFDNIHQVQLFRGSGDTEYYNYGTLFYALVRGASKVAETVGVPKPSTLDPQKIESAQDWFALNDFASQTHLAGRIVSAFAGALTVVFVFLALRRFTSLAGSASGAALVALAPAHIMHSRFQTVDVLATCLVAAATWAALRLLRSDLKAPVLEAAFAGALVGLAAGTRYSNVLALIAVLVALWLRRPFGLWKAMSVAIVASVIAFFIAVPGALLDNANFLADVQYQAKHAAEGHGYVFLNTPPGFWLFIEYLSDGISEPAALMGLAGLIWGAIERRAWAWGALGFFIPYFLSIGGLETKFLRYGFPLYVGVALGFGYVVHKIRERTASSALALAAAVLAMIGLRTTTGLRGAAQYTAWMLGADPRDEAARYLKRVSTPGTTVGFTAPAWFWSVALVRDAGFTMFQPQGVKDAFMEQTRQPRVVIVGAGDPPDYIAYSSYEMGDVMRLKGVEGLPEGPRGGIEAGNALLEWIGRNYTLVQTLGEGGSPVHDLQYIRPQVWIWRRNDVPPPAG